LTGGVGGGGLGAGGAIFVATGATVKVTYTATTSASNTFKDNTVVGGVAGDITGNDGQNLGEALFLGGDTTVEVTGAFEATIDQTLGGAAGDANFHPENDFATTYSDALGGIIKEGTGTLILESDDNTYVGTTEVALGTLIAEGGNAIGDYSPVDVQVAATLLLEDDETAGYLAGDGTVVLNGKTLTLAGMIENDPAGDFQGQFDTNSQPNSKVIKEGTGELTLSGDNSSVNYQLEIYDGTVIVGHQNALGDETLNRVKIYTDPYSSPDSLSNTLEASTSFTVATAIPNGFDIQSGKELKVGGNEDIALGGRIRSNSVAMIMDSPTKKLILSNDSAIPGDKSSYSKTRIFEGTLAVTSGEALGGSQVEVADNGGALEAEGADVFLDNTIKFLSSYRLAVGGSSGFNLTLDGAITGNGGITKTGPHTVTLSGTNSYKAETEIEDGTLVAADGQAIYDAGIVNFTLGGIFQVDDSETIGLVKSGGAPGHVALEPGANLTLQGASGSVDEAFDGFISGSGGLTKQGAYTQRLTGHNTYTGGTNIDAGKLGINFNDSLGVGGTVKFASDATLLIISSGLTLTHSLEVESSGGQIEWDDPGAPAGGHIFTWAPATIAGDGMMSVDLKGISGNVSTFKVDQDAAVDPSFGGFEPADFTEVDFTGGGNIAFVLIGPSGSFNANHKNVVYDSTSDRVFGGTLNDILELQKKNTGTLTFNSDSTVTAETVAVEDGILAVEDSDFTVTNPAGTTISGGSLQLENDGLAGNTFNSNVTVDTGVLKGVGTIDGDVTNNSGGRIQPGSSSDPFGTLHVTGDFDNNGGEINIELQRTGSSYENSKILADGTASIDNGSLVVNAEAGTLFVVDAQVPFVEASFVTVPADISVMTLTGGSHATRYKLEPYNTAAAYGFVIKEAEYFRGLDRFTRNNNAIGDYFTEFQPTGAKEPVDMGTVTGVIQALADQAPAYDQLDGAVFGSASSLGVQATTNMFQVIGTRLRPNALALCPAPTSMWRYGRTDNESLFRHGQPAAEAAWSGWVTVARLAGDATTDGNALGLDYMQDGGLVGIQRNLDLESNVGMFFSYGQSSIDIDQVVHPGNGNSPPSVNRVKNRVTTENEFLGAYLTRDYGLGYSMVVAGLGHDQYDSRRQISFLDPVRQAVGDHDGWQAGIYTEHGLTYGLSNLFFQPYGALQYVYFGQDGFTETGAGSINLVVDDFSFNSFRMMLGGRLAGSFLGPTWELRAQWIHEVLHETAPVMNASFRGGWDSTFAIEGLSLGRDWALLGAGFDWQVWPRFNFFANYNWQVNGYQSFGVGSGGAEFRW
jgi:autotransporter-associated beta strand protein